MLTIYSKEKTPSSKANILVNHLLTDSHSWLVCTTYIQNERVNMVTIIELRKEMVNSHDLFGNWINLMFQISHSCGSSVIHKFKIDFDWANSWPAGTYQLLLLAQWDLFHLHLILLRFVFTFRVWVRIDVYVQFMGSFSVYNKTLNIFRQSCTLLFPKLVWKTAIPISDTGS